MPQATLPQASGVESLPGDSRCPRISLKPDYGGIIRPARPRTGREVAVWRCWSRPARPGSESGRLSLQLGAGGALCGACKSGPGSLAPASLSADLRNGTGGGREEPCPPASPAPRCERGCFGAVHAGRSVCLATRAHSPVTDAPLRRGTRCQAAQLLALPCGSGVSRQHPPSDTNVKGSSWPQILQVMAASLRLGV